MQVLISIYFCSVLPSRLHDDDDESEIKSIRTRMRYMINTVSCRLMKPLWCNTWLTMRLYLTIVFDNKNIFIVNQVWNHSGFMRLHDTVFILHHIHVRIDLLSDSSSCRRKSNTLQKHIGFIKIWYYVNAVSELYSWLAFAHTRNNVKALI